MTTASEPRIPPLRDEEMSDAGRDIMEAAGRSWNVFRTMVNHPDLARRWLVFANHVLFKSTLPARERELVILRIGWLCRAEYEFAQHREFGRSVGLTDDEIDRVVDGPDAPGWSDLDRLLLRATDELHRHARITDATWSALGERYTTEQLMDLVFAIGEYQLVSMALNTFGVPLDEGLVGFPQHAGTGPVAEVSRQGDRPTVTAPDGTTVTILHRVAGASTALFELAPGETAHAVRHRTVDEVWHVLAGQGEMWLRESGASSGVVEVLEAGATLTIPVGTSIQLRTAGDDPFVAHGVTSPPWPGDDEAELVDGNPDWTPTVSG